MGLMPAESVQRKLATLPESPGVYIFRHHEGGVLYIGKARNLRARVRSYFQRSTSDTRAFIRFLDREVGDLETAVVANEKEAALLEEQLIKQHRPRYNVRLRDDKRFLSLRLDPHAAWPRLELVRHVKADAARYFGPYPSAASARQTLRLVNRHFQLRTCTDSEMRNRVRPCLQYQIHRCPAPCVLDVDRQRYGEHVRDVGLFLDGQYKALRIQVEEHMQKASQRRQFEKAAMYRDQLVALDRMQQNQRVASHDEVDQDVLGLYRSDRDDTRVELALLKVRGGHVLDLSTFSLSRCYLPDDALVASFLSDYYQPGSFVPREVLLPCAVELMPEVADRLSQQAGRRVYLYAPKRGKRAQVLRMAMENAVHAFREKATARASMEAKLQELQDTLHLPGWPQRIECVDISHTGGQDAVAAIACLIEGEAQSQHYRYFRLKEARGGDDYGAMFEVLSRRLQRAKEQQEGWALPDVLVVDGGRGQLNMALAVLRELGIDGLAVIGLAKERDSEDEEKRHDRVFLPGQLNPIAVHTRPSLRLLSHVRDEAHRSANAFRIKQQKARELDPRLDGIRGIGRKTRTLLLRRFGSMDALAKANVDELLQAGITRRQAQAIYRALRSQESRA